MALEVYFRDDIRADLASTLATFLAAQFLTGNPDALACQVALAIISTHAARYMISVKDLRSTVTEILDDSLNPSILDKIDHFLLAGKISKPQ